ncbi:hypothetical protein Aduo_014848 [Ancylostoma duodenale]
MHFYGSYLSLRKLGCSYNPDHQRTLVAPFGLARHVAQDKIATTKKATTNGRSSYTRNGSNPSLGCIGKNGRINSQSSSRASSDTGASEKRMAQDTLCRESPHTKASSATLDFWKVTDRGRHRYCLRGSFESSAEGSCLLTPLHKCKYDAIYALVLLMGVTFCFILQILLP